MKDLFDMISGTSTGSIITGAMVFPPETKHKNENREFFSTQLLEIYTEKGALLFSSVRMGAL